MEMMDRKDRSSSVDIQLKRLRNSNNWGGGVLRSKYWGHRCGCHLQNQGKPEQKGGRYWGLLL